MTKPIPDGFTSITPHMVCRDAAKAIDFYKKAFGAVEIMRMPGPEGKLMHAQIKIGNAFVMLCDEFPAWKCLGPQSLGGCGTTIHLYVNDADAAWKKAVDAGATVTMEIQDMFWGDRYGKVLDPFGHEWSIATKKQDLTPAQIAENAKKMGM